MRTRPEEKIDSPFTMESGHQHETFKALFRRGARITDLYKIRSHPEAENSAASRVADMIREGCNAPFPTDKQLLDSIEKDQYFGVRSWQNLFGMEIDDDIPLPLIDIQSLLSSSCPLTPGKCIGETQFLFVVPEHFEYHPASIRGVLEWRQELKIVNSERGNYLGPVHWDPSKNEEDSGMKGEFKERIISRARWMLIYRGIIPGSKGKSRQEQIAMIPPNYRPATCLEAHVGMSAYRYTSANMTRRPYDPTPKELRFDITGRVMEEDVQIHMNSISTHYRTDPSLFFDNIVGMFVVREL